MPQQANLTNFQADKIRRIWAKRPTVKKLAKEYNVTEAVIQNILRGQKYREPKRLKFNIESLSFPVKQKQEQSCTTAQS